MTLEERYTKAMKLAGYELIDTPPESPVGITFMKTFGGQTIGFDGWEMVGMELENLKAENELHQKEFEELVYPIGTNFFEEGTFQFKDYENLPTRLLVDMDGVLAKFKQVDTLELLYEKNYFLNLEPVENVIEAVRLIKAEHPEIEVYILSSVLSDSEYALAEKNEWLNQYLPEIDAEHRLFPPCGVNKASYVPDGIGVTDFLLDDYTHNLTSWEPPARGIKLLNGINHTNETWNGNMLRFDKEPRELADNIISVMGGELIQDLKPQSDVDRFKEEFLAVLGEVKEIRKELEDIHKNMKPKVMLETEQKKGTVSPVIPRTKNKTSPKL